ncbi:MAG: hypothetical protein ACJ75F_01730 [Flavisolibacter sp.]|jgi:hypothetical protein
MPHSRKRPGHHPYKKAADIPSKQRTNGKLTWALLFAVFGLLISFFAAGLNYLALAAGTIVAALIGFSIGKNMEQAAKK